MCATPVWCLVVTAKARHDDKEQNTEARKTLAGTNGGGTAVSHDTNGNEKEKKTFYTEACRMTIANAGNDVPGVLATVDIPIKACTPRYRLPSKGSKCAPGVDDYIRV